MPRWLLVTGILAFAAAGFAAAAAPPTAGPVPCPVFGSGQDGYDTFRIPSLIATPRGNLLAFAEGRKQSAGDAGDIDVVLKRSLDGGQTWLPLQVVWNDGRNTCGNPCVVIDGPSGTVWLLLTWNRGDDTESSIIAQTSHDTRRVFITFSTDEGMSWAAPTEITSAVKRTNWTWVATGPGAGIQMEQGPWAGRLVVPCDHMEAGTKRYFSHVIYSDDDGRHWQIGGSSPRDQVNECEVTELPGGRLMLNMRNYDRIQPTRQVAFSADGGRTWSGQRHQAELIDPVCQASLRRYAWSGPGRRSVLLFSNPAGAKRERLTVRASFDDGETWPAARVLNEGPSAYSCLAILPGGDIACLYERGKDNPYETIAFARFTLAWLEGTAKPAAAAP